MKHGRHDAERRLWHLIALAACFKTAVVGGKPLPCAAVADCEKKSQAWPT